MAAPLAGGSLCFTQVEVAVRDGDTVARHVLPVAELRDMIAALGGDDPRGRRLAKQFERAQAVRAPFAGVTMDRARVMGILNVTPDSFSDGGDYLDHDQAAGRVAAMIEEGAEIVDIGGESTRPGAAEVPADEETRRIMPALDAARDAGAVVSIDTRKPEVMRRAAERGAAIINDVTALTHATDSLPVAAETGLPVVLMHMRGEPGTMQKDPRYDDAALDVYDYLEARVEACEAAGMTRERIAVDPGIGFGKTVAHNVEILRALAMYHTLGCPVLVGASRKSMIAVLSRGEAPKERVPGSLAIALHAASQGVQILRVHDVAATVQALAVHQALCPAS